MGFLEKIRKELLKDKIIKDFKITEQEKEILKKNWCNSNFIKNETQLEKWKKENLQSDEDWKFFISRDLKWNKWCVDKFKDKIIALFQERKGYLDNYIYSIIRLKSEGTKQNK